MGVSTVQGTMIMEMLADMLMDVSNPLHFQRFSLGEQHICNQ